MSGVQSIERAFALLRALAAGPAGVTELAERSELPKSTVYRLLGAEGLGTEVMPSIDRPTGGTLAYHVRTGGHDLTRWDWLQYLTFADRHLK